MDKKLQNIFQKLSDEITPDPKLAGVILSRVKHQEVLQMKRKLALIYAGLSLGAGFLFWALASYGSAFLQSDFWSLMTLAYSDTALILRNWSDFTYSLLETLPLFSMVLMLIPVFVLFLLISAYFKIINNNHYKYN